LIKSNIANNDTMVYVVLGAIAVAAFGGYLFLRKKKENA
jgi:LPXTG-motif cell wall-anchored protein